MQFSKWHNVLVATLVAVAGLTAGGCGQADDKGGAAKGKRGLPQDKQVAQDAKGQDHSRWWCDEHGIPEEECSLCNAKVAAEFKKKGDWCEKHDRAKSQCFLCDPSLKEKYAARYRAKYGKEPPPTEDEEKDSKPASKK
jgi:hypothetical protein